MDPSSAGLAKQPLLPRSGVTPLEAGRLPSAQPSTVGKKRVADGVASSSKQKQNLDPRTSHPALQASNARSATPFVVKSANPVGTDLAQGNVGAIAGESSLDYLLSLRRLERPVADLFSHIFSFLRSCLVGEETQGIRLAIWENGGGGGERFAGQGGEFCRVSILLLPTRADLFPSFLFPRILRPTM